MDLFRVKNINNIKEVDDSNSLKRNLSTFDILFLGIGAVIGTGVFVMTGVAAANYAGPAIMISYLIAGISAIFVALKEEKLDWFNKLLEIGADINILDEEGNNILHQILKYELKNNIYQLIETLIDKGIDIYQENNNGISPYSISITIADNHLNSIMNKKSIENIEETSNSNSRSGIN